MIDKPKSIYLSSYKCLTQKVLKEIIKYDGPYVYIDGLIFDITKNVTSVDIDIERKLENQITIYLNLSHFGYEF